MKRLACVTGVLALMAAVSLTMTPVEAQGSKTPTIKDIMDKLNKGTNCLGANIGKDLKADNPPWDEIQKETKEFAVLAASLPANNPPKGDKASWSKLAQAYADNARALDDAARKKDKRTAQTIQARLLDNQTCSACHKAHRGK